MFNQISGYPGPHFKLTHKIDHDTESPKEFLIPKTYKSLYLLSNAMCLLIQLGTGKSGLSYKRSRYINNTVNVYQTLILLKFFSLSLKNYTIFSLKIPVEKDCTS